MASLQPASIDLILCDLPYGLTQNRWDVRIPLEPLWAAMLRVTKPRSAIILTASQPFTSLLVMSQPRLFRYSLVWQKTSPTGFLNANRAPLRAHEDIVVFYRRAPVYHPQKTNGHPRKVSTASHGRNSARSPNYGRYGPHNYDSTERYPTSVLQFPHDRQRSALHATQKPVALMEWLVRTYTDEGAVVLDPCMGSGTTGVACVRSRREFIGIDCDPAMMAVARERAENGKM